MTVVTDVVVISLAAMDAVDVTKLTVTTVLAGGVNVVTTKDVS